VTFQFVRLNIWLGKVHPVTGRFDGEGVGELKPPIPAVPPVPDVPPVGVAYIPDISAPASARLKTYTWSMRPVYGSAPFCDPMVSGVSVSIAEPEPVYADVPDRTPSTYMFAVFVELLVPVIICHLPSFTLADETAVAVTPVPPELIVNVAFPPEIASL